MHFHRGTERASRRLGEIVLIGAQRSNAGKIRRSSTFRAEVTALLTAHWLPVYSRAADGIDTLQSRMVLVVY
jgi:hypothetical protein